MAPSKFRFRRFGECGASITELLPHIRLCQCGQTDSVIIRSMHTDAINHDPAITFL